VECKTYPVLLSEAWNAEFQNFGITLDPYEIATSQLNLQYHPKGTIIINKTSSGENNITRTAYR